MRNSQLAARFTVLVAVFGILFLVFVALVYTTLDTVRVKGRLYNQIVLGKDLIADILPPPEYIIESYLVTLEMENETDAARIQQLIERGNRLRFEYENRQE